MMVSNLPHMLTLMSESSVADHPRLNIEQFLVGGGTLKKYWDAEGTGSPRTLIATQPWDYVVIQEIFCADTKEFETYARLFDDVIRKAGSKTILFATANISEYFSAQYKYPDSFKQLNDMQLAFGKKCEIPVAAAGYAWMRYLGDHPSKEQMLDLYHEDKAHPGKRGTYIYACLLYAAITGKNPEGLTCEFPDITGDAISKKEGSWMQKAAWYQWKENEIKQNKL